MERNKIIVVQRDIMAMLVPSGAKVMIYAGTEVRITQALGNSFTVNVYDNLARIDSKDADALGQAVSNPCDTLPLDATIEDKVWAQLRSVYDPEIPVNIVDLGLIYQCCIQEQVVNIEMTLTAPGCGMGPVLVEDVKNKILSISDSGITTVNVTLVFTPPWTQELMSEVAKLELGLL